MQIQGLARKAVEALLREGSKAGLPGLRRFPAPRGPRPVGLHAAGQGGVLRRAGGEGEAPGPPLGAAGAPPFSTKAGGGLLFEEPAPELPAPSAYDDKTILRQEVETLGMLLSCHPLLLHRRELERIRPVPASADGEWVGRYVTMIGWWVTGKTVQDKNGRPMEFVSFEDTTAIFDATFFPKAYERFCRMLSRSRPYLLKGKVEESFGVATLNVEWVLLPGVSFSAWRGDRSGRHDVTPDGGKNRKNHWSQKKPQDSEGKDAAYGTKDNRRNRDVAFCTNGKGAYGIIGKPNEKNTPDRQQSCLEIGAADSDKGNDGYPDNARAYHRKQGCQRSKRAEEHRSGDAGKIITEAGGNSLNKAGEKGANRHSRSRGANFGKIMMRFVLVGSETGDSRGQHPFAVTVNEKENKQRHRQGKKEFSKVFSGMGRCLKEVSRCTRSQSGAESRKIQTEPISSDNQFFYERKTAESVSLGHLEGQSETFPFLVPVGGLLRDQDNQRGNGQDKANGYGKNHQSRRETGLTGQLSGQPVVVRKGRDTDDKSPCQRLGDGGRQQRKQADGPCRGKSRHDAQINLPVHGCHLYQAATKPAE
jgi:hypothetical protein